MSGCVYVRQSYQHIITTIACEYASMVLLTCMACLQCESGFKRSSYGMPESNCHMESKMVAGVMTMHVLLLMAQLALLAMQVGKACVELNRSCVKRAEFASPPFRMISSMQRSKHRACCVCAVLCCIQRGIFTIVTIAIILLLSLLLSFSLSN